MKRFFAWLSAFLLFTAPANGERILLPCDSCGPYHWLVVEQTGEKKILSWNSATNQALFGQEAKITAKLVNYDRRLNARQAAAASQQAKTLLKETITYEADGFLPQKYRDKEFAIFSNGRIDIATERSEAWPLELFLLLVSVLWLGILYAARKNRYLGASEWLFWPIAVLWMATTAAALAPFLGKDISNTPASPAIFILVLMMLITTLCLILMASLLVAALLEKTLKGKTTARLNSFPLEIPWLLALAATTAILPAFSSGKTIPSVFFTIFLPGLISGLSLSKLGRYLDRKEGEKDKKNKNLQELGPHE